MPVTSGGRLIGAALMLLGVAFVPAVTSIIVAILVAQFQQRDGRRADHDDIAERLERLEARRDGGG